LAGGTALALHFGHRLSIDLDFFSASDFNVRSYQEKLSELGNFSLTKEAAGTLDGILDEVKISLFCYHYPLLFPVIVLDGVAVADPRDIACMKLDAISSRGSKKDFVDMAFLLERYSLEDIFEWFEKKYSTLQYNKMHILKSLTYFDDAEQEPSPQMLIEKNWEAVKMILCDHAKNFLQNA
jgi:hypothetical protein